MKKRTKVIIVLLALYLFFSLCSVFYAHISLAKETFLYEVASCIKLYISQNNGNFPLSKEDLFEKGYLKTEITDGNSHVRMKIIANGWPEEEVAPGHIMYRNGKNFKFFDINYGVKIEDLKLEKNKLIDVHTDEPVLLISGPTKFSFTSYYWPRRYYDFISIKLYEEMLNYQNIQKQELKSQDPEPNQPKIIK